MLQFRKGDLLFREGDKSDFVYRLVSGEAEIVRHVPKGLESVGQIHVGDFIGEMGVLISCRRSGSARFCDDSQVERFSRDDFISLVFQDSQLSARLLHALSLRTRSQVEYLHDLPGRDAVDRMRRHRPLLWLSQAMIRLFDPVNELLRHRLKAYFSSRELPKKILHAQFPELVIRQGTVLFEEGEVSDKVYWIASGRAHILKRVKGSARKIGQAGSKEFIGEMGVLESMPRNASVQAVTMLTVRVISPSDFFTLMRNSPEAYRIVMDSLCERARRLRRILREISAVAGSLPAARDDLFEMASAMESVAQLAEQRLVEETLKLRRFFQVQVDHGRYIKSVYQNYLKGKATKEEMEKANAYFRDYLKMAGLGTLFLLPGAVLTVPLAVKVGKAMGIDILPSSDSEKDVEVA